MGHRRGGQDDYHAGNPAFPPATLPVSAPPSHLYFRFRRGSEVGGRRLRAEEVEEEPGGSFPPPRASRFGAEWSGGRVLSGAG